MILTTPSTSSDETNTSDVTPAQQQPQQKYKPKFPYTTPEDVKAFWLKWGSHYQRFIRKDIYKEQQDQLIETLKQDFDMSKVETILDVGCGYGRIAKLLLDEFPKIRVYDGFDISNDQLNNALQYVPGMIFHPLHGDFEDYEFQWCYDLVVCVETMTVLPYSIQFWIDRLASLSKKYIVSLDWYDINPNAPRPISDINTWHDYPSEYTKSKDVLSVHTTQLPKYTESIFTVRVK